MSFVLVRKETDNTYLFTEESLESFVLFKLVNCVMEELASFGNRKGFVEKEDYGEC